jgi:hypothetical protein
MTARRWKVTLALGLVLAAGWNGTQIFAQDKPPAKAEEPTAPKPTEEEQKRIDKLIAQLGADGFEEREQAQKDLEKIGPAALESARKAAKSKDSEVARRAGDLVTRFEEMLKTDKVLAPKMVNLKFKDVSVVDAVADLSKQSGYPITIGGDKAKLAERKVTLETGEVSFWEAFDKLCLKAGLVEPASDGKTAGPLQVIEGTPVATPTHYAGALRVRVLPDTVKRKDGVAEFMLELAIEPRFRQPKVMGAARIETAVDDAGKSLAALTAPSEKPTLLRAPAGLMLGEKQKALKELSGSVMFETIMADKVLAIDDVAKNVGKSVKNDEGAVLSLDQYDRKKDGEVTIRATLTKAVPRQPGGGIAIGPETFKEFQPELRDAAGQTFQKVASPANRISFNGTTLSVSQTITYKPNPGCGDPAELSLTSDKTTALRVPFTFKDLKLP